MLLQQEQGLQAHGQQGQGPQLQGQRTKRQGKQIQGKESQEQRLDLTEFGLATWSFNLTYLCRYWHNIQSHTW
jgi:hypothetical protein